ncbi:MAG: DNA polymerase III subunit delta' [Betaproteobacteria bacterium]
MSDVVTDVAGTGPWPALLPWQHDAARTLLAGRATWPHAMLLAGPRGIGKHVLALNLGRSLLCESPEAQGFACGTCPSCVYVTAGQHPDLRIVEPFMTEDDGTVKVLDAIPVLAIRDLIRWAQITSHRGRAKVAVIVPAESMNPSAANALLKTLEEPPADTYLILVAHQPGRLPATVRSRCRLVPAPRADAPAARAWLEAMGVPNATSVLGQAGGAPLVAMTLADPALQLERKFWLDALAAPKTMSPVALAGRIDGAPRDERKVRLAQGIDWLLAWTADLGRVASGGEAAFNPDFAIPLATLARAVAPRALFRYHRSLLRQRSLVAHPLQPRLVAEMVLLDYRSVFS